MSTLKVDPDALAATKPGIATVADKVIAAIKNVQTVVQAEGECWGADEIGENFAKKYVPDAESGLQGIEALGKCVESLAGGVDSIAQAFQQQDDANAKALEKAKSQI
ncbi:hypothetical protein [Nocardia goodfellowii]|uniref:Uncharacterized protein YukE n=1 Tax=Nocardia goodfellowii TaxID=882446 RepID=A0ABS4Q8V2_9NOCA|nr:hypothetical protein [Nocardia goodfellowii]MBP2187538.1 uncharacterized protein YukE [Nocardia goodfellowii]